MEMKITNCIVEYTVSVFSQIPVGTIGRSDCPDARDYETAHYANKVALIHVLFSSVASVTFLVLISDPSVHGLYSKR